MKKLLISKTAAVLVFAMMVSILTPVIAFGASFAGVSRSGNTVTGSVYLTDAEYDALTDSSKIVVGVYGSNGVLGSTYATYTTYSTYGYQFKFTYSITAATYFKYGSAMTSLYSYSSSSTSSTYSTSGTSTGITTGGSVSSAELTALLKANENATLMTTSEVVNLPADALIIGKSLTIMMADGTSYTLPIAALHLDELAKSLGVELKDLKIRVEMKLVTGDAATAVNAAVTTAGGKALAHAFDFKVFAVAGGKETEIKNFGQFVSRTLPLLAALTDTSKAIGVMFNPATKKLSFVPATFATVNGKTIATLKRNGNSIYTVIEVGAVSFSDINGHWAQKDIESLAAKKIVEGTGDNKFEPNGTISRAEFTALILRSLGIETTGATSSVFSDVASSAWYAGTVAAAADAGLIKGNGKGQFNPTAKITRKEMAAIVVRAMELAGKDAALTNAEVAATLADFTDAGNLGWAKAEVAAAVKAGVVNGQSSTKLVGDSTASRAEAATLIIRFLGNVGFIQ